MEGILEVIGVGGKAIIASAAAWIISALVKAILNFARNKNSKKALRASMKGGGMPSGHTASMAGLTACLGMLEGFDSAIFALALCMSIVIIYDAMNVRYAVGVNAKILQKAHKTEPVKIVEGHRPLEVLVGAIIGIAIGISIAFL